MQYESDLKTSLQPKDSVYVLEPERERERESDLEEEECRE